MDCPHARCGAPVPKSYKDCPACGRFVGFPNVRQAEEQEERDALAERLRLAQHSINARSVSPQVDLFVDAMAHSELVLARSISDTEELFASEQNHYTSHHRKLMAKTRAPRDNPFDAIRTQFESAQNPNFFEEILYGCLSLNSRGITYYGDVTWCLKADAIEERTSVFEENPFLFVQKHNILMSDQFPPGYRESWGARANLAKAKLHAEITAASTLSDFPAILIKENADGTKTDFIEAHIYGVINLHSIQKVVRKVARNKRERVIWEDLEEVIRDAGVELENW